MGVPSSWVEVTDPPPAGQGPGAMEGIHVFLTFLTFLKVPLLYLLRNNTLGLLGLFMTWGKGILAVSS